MYWINLIFMPFRRIGRMLSRLDRWIQETVGAFFEDLPEICWSINKYYGAGNNVSDTRAREMRIRQFMRNDIRMFGKDSYYRAGTLMMYGDFLRENGRFTDAIKPYTEAVELHLMHLPVGDKKLTQALSAVGSFFHCYALYARAEKYLKLAVDSKRASLAGGADLELAQEMEKLAESMMAGGNFDAAAEQFERVIEMLEDILGITNASVNEKRSKLAGLYRDAGFHSRHAVLSEEVMRVNAVQVIVSAVGPEHMLLVRDLDALADFYMKHGQAKKARAMQEESRYITLINNTKVPDYAGILPDLAELARMYDERGHKTAAFRLRQRAEALKEKRLYQGASAGK